jgi:hypothetical protein
MTDDPRVSFRAAYERFPVAIKGAFVLRGADGLPHQVKIASARAAECSGRMAHPLPLDGSIVEAAPTLDTFVPFEVPTLDLEPGWYRLECEAFIDGDPVTIHPGKRFAIAWPRGQVRRGTVDVHKKIGSIAVETLECLGDSVRITYAGSDLPALRLKVDGGSHAILESTHDDDAGSGSIFAYPVLRRQERLSIEIRGETPLEIALP